MAQGDFVCKVLHTVLQGEVMKMYLIKIIELTEILLCQVHVMNTDILLVVTTQCFTFKIILFCTLSIREYSC